MKNGERLQIRQYRFLRDLREAAESGLCDHPWPRVTTLRRWLRKPGFRAAMRSLQAALRFQRDWMLSVSSAQAARNMAAMVWEQDPRCGLPDPDSRLQTLVRIIRTEQIRQRESTQKRKHPQPLHGAEPSAMGRPASHRPALATDRPVTHRPGEIGGNVRPASLVMSSWTDGEQSIRRDTGDEANDGRSHHRPAGMG